MPVSYVFNEFFFLDENSTVAVDAIKSRRKWNEIFVMVECDDNSNLRVVSLAPRFTADAAFVKFPTAKKR